MELKQDWRAFEGVFGQVRRQATPEDVTAETLDREAVDRWLVEALDRPHYLEQWMHLKRMFSTAHTHFFLDDLLGVWKKVLPSTGGIYLKIEGQKPRSLLLVFHGGALDGYCEPDLNHIGPTRAKNPEDVVKYLSGKYMVPVQGVYFNEQEWDALGESEHPLMDFMKAVKAKTIRLEPSRWALLAFTAASAFWRK